MVIVSTVCETLFRVLGAQNMDSICDFHGVTTISKFLHMQNFDFLYFLESEAEN